MSNNDTRLMGLWNLFKQAEAEVGGLLAEVKRVARYHGRGVALDEAQADIPENIRGRYHSATFKPNGSTSCFRIAAFIRCATASSSSFKT